MNEKICMGKSSMKRMSKKKLTKEVENALREMNYCAAEIVFEMNIKKKNYEKQISIWRE